VSTDWLFAEDTATDAGRQIDDIDLIMARTFGTQEGQLALKWLREQTIEQPGWVPGQDASHGFAREGQNSLVREIERRIRRTKT
jgi:hypothetical protein